MLIAMKAYHAESNQVDVPFDRKSCFQVVQYYIEHRDSLPLIAIDEMGVHGILLGSLEPYFFNSKRCYGTDLFFFSKGYGPKLWRLFKEWAFANGADKIIMGVSSEDARAGHLLEALGMTNTGGMYVLRQESS
jgi:hypothetical protein